MLERQTARTGCWVTRNAHLSGRESIPTNPAFVYSTPEVSFPSAVVPAIVASETIGPLAAQGTFAATLEAALSDLAQAGSAASASRLVKVALTYGYDIGPVGGVRAGTAILLADELRLRADSANGDEDGSFSLADLCEALDADCHVWFQYYAPVTTGATVSVALFLFAEVAGARLPIIEIEDLQLSVSPSWWQAGSSR